MEQIIWFHGTSKANAESIKREGFRAGTYFAAHMEDAVRYGGFYVFAVRVKWDSPSLDGWQVVSANHIGPEKIRVLTIIASVEEDKALLEREFEQDFPHLRSVP